MVNERKINYYKKKFLILKLEIFFINNYFSSHQGTNTSLASFNNFKCLVDIFSAPWKNF